MSNHPNPSFLTHETTILPREIHRFSTAKRSVLRGAGVAEPDLLEAQAVPGAGAAGGRAARGLHLVRGEEIRGVFRMECLGKCWKNIWLVVLSIMKHISQWEGLSHILWKISNVWNHQPDMV